MRTCALILIIILLVSSCGSYNKKSYVQQETITTVRVENQNWLDMNVYVLIGGQRKRLGTVRGLKTEVLIIPEHLIKVPTFLRFIADPIGGQQMPVSHEVTVTPGDEVEMVISN